MSRLISLGMTSNLLNAIHASLSDYTNDQRGDVGSLVRLQAIDAAATALASKDTTSVLHRQNLTASICSLAVEKLDKVRFRASGCLQSNWIIFSLHYQPPLCVYQRSSSQISFLMLIAQLRPRHLSNNNRRLLPTHAIPMFRSMAQARFLRRLHHISRSRF